MPTQNQQSNQLQTNYKPTPEQVFLSVPGAEPLKDAYLWPIDRIVGFEDQPREFFDDKEINDLAANIRRRSDLKKGVAETGFIHPILGRWEHGAITESGNIKKNARLVIIAGEKRFHGAKRAGLRKVPVNVVDEDDDDAFEDALLENILRGDMTPRELGQAFLALMNLKGWKGRSRYANLARHLYSDASRKDYIRGLVTGLNLGEDADILVTRNKKTAVAARRIAAIKDIDKRRELISFMANGGTVRQLEEKIRAYRQEEATQKGASSSNGAAGSHSNNGLNNGSKNLGTPKKPGVITVPRFNLEGAFDVIETQAKAVYDAMQPPVDLTKSQKRQLLKRNQEAQELLERIADFLTAK